MPDTNPIPTENPDLTSTIPLQGMPEDATNVYATPPATVQPQQPPALTSTIPSETPPNNPDIDRQYHENLLHRIMRVTADTLAPSETAQVTMDKQGNVTMQKVPATTSEKWHNIAAAALGGLASGLQNAQGPGGFGKAIAAGTQYGLQLPQQRQQEAEKQATVQSELQMHNAQHAMLDQQITKLFLENKNAPMLQARDYANWRLDMATKLDAVGAEFVGKTADMEGIAQLAKRDPTLLDAHTGKTSDRVMPVPEKDGSISWYRVPSDTANQKYTQPWIYDKVSLNPDGTVKHNTFTAPANQDTVSKHLVDEKALLTQNNEVYKQSAELLAKRAEATDTYAKSMAAASDAYARGDKAEGDRLTKLGNQQLAGAKQLKTVNQVSVGSPQTLGNWGTLLSDPHSGVTLANVPPKERDAVVNAMNAQGQKIAKPLTADEIKRSDLANNAISNIEEAQAIMQRRPDLFGPAGWGKSKFRRAIEGGDPDALAYQTAINLANLPAVGIHGVRGKWALEDLSKLDSDLYINRQSMENVLNEIHRSASEFAPAGGRIIAPSGGGGAATGGGQGNISQAARQPEPKVVIPKRPPNVSANATYIKDSMGHYQWVENLEKAKTIDPKLTVIGQ